MSQPTIRSTTVIAVLPVEASNLKLREQLREEMYRGIFEKKYSAIKLQSVDARLDASGKFDPGDLVFDATLTVTMETWKPMMSVILLLIPMELG